MKTSQKLVLVCLIILFVSVVTFGQKKKTQAVVRKENKVKEIKPRVFSPDNSLISKSIIQSRQITDYTDGGAFICGIFGRSNECDYQKIREFIWTCWTEKTLGYFTISFSSVDAFSTEHVFIEPNNKNQWQVVRKIERSHGLLKVNKIENLPTAFSVERVEAEQQKDEPTLILKNKFGKIIDKY